MASVRFNPQRGNYIVRWRDPLTGKQTSRTLASQAEAEAARHRVEHKLDRQKSRITTAKARRRLNGTAPPIDRALTVAQLCERYAEAKHVRRPQTKSKIGSCMRAHILPRFGRLRCTDVTPEAVQRWVNELADGRAATTVHEYYGIFKAMYGFARERDLLELTPCVGIALPRKARKDARFLDPHDELPRLVDAFDERYREMIWIAAYTGLRPGELFALRWTDIDLKRNELHVRGTVERQEDGAMVRVDLGKSDAFRRSLVMFTPVRRTLLALREEKQSDEAGDVAFTAPGGGVISKDTFRDRFWNPAVERAGLDTSRGPVTMYCLRHTCAALLIDRGFSAYRLQKWMGHAAMSTTFGCYGHLLDRDDELARAFDDVTFD